MDNSRRTAIAISAAINDLTFDAAGVAKEMQKEHKTLQQCFTRLCVEWLKVCASDGYQTDMRNEASHNVAKMLMDGHEDIPEIPFL